MDNLFGVFNEQPQDIGALEKEKLVPKGSNKPKDGSKRKAEDVKQNRKKVKVSKKKDKEQEAPIVADSLEIETSREVTASSGLLAQKAETTKPEDNKVQLRHQVRHQVAVPPGYNYVPIAQHKRVTQARTYPFTLDPFQDTAISCIDRDESVLVSAHTSAGKTVVAEYAIAQSLRDKQRVIYTSPIKALSNQKYRELQAEFGDVGLMTGDVTINPDAGCLVMTTEILRSMLYRGSEVMREVAWVIFDEVHYMRDKSRGVVWEETIIMLPDKVHYVFLSATIPNAMEFAQWICKIHQQPCHIVYTDFRPTPLQHYLFPDGGEGIYLVVDEKGTFREENFQKAMSSISNQEGDDPGAVFSRGSKKGSSFKGNKKDSKSDIYKIVKMIWVKKYNPVIVFSFSKRDCEQLAMKMSKLDFNTEDEKQMLTKIFNNAIDILSDEDKELPQIKSILPLLKRGIGIHHSGLLPILKEIIEILFQEGFLKVLFATETFSIGLNMPAKTVVFTSVRKWDGVGFRWVSGGEYIQMSGRAGRRGLDDRGIVIMMIDEKMEPQIAKSMVKGQADRLDSAFHLGYNMILNLLRVEGISPEFMMDSSFFQFQQATSIPDIEKQISEKKALLDGIHIEDETDVKEYYDLQQQLDGYREDERKVITHPSNILPHLKSGRLLKVKVADNNYGWAIVIDFNRRSNKRHPEQTFKDHESYLVNVFVNTMFADAPINLIKSFSPTLPEGIRPSKEGEKSITAVIPITLDSIQEISSCRSIMPKDINNKHAQKTLDKALKEIVRRHPDGLPLLDPVSKMNIKDNEFKTLLKKVEVLTKKMQANPVASSSELDTEYAEYSRKMVLEDDVKELVAKKSQVESIIQLDELKHRKRVLRRLEFISANDVVELKGRVACEISTGDELLLTELIFNGTFNELNPEQCAALLSCFVFEERSNEQPRLKPELQEPLNQLQEMARKIARVSRESKIEIVEKDYVESFRFELMEVVYSWCKKATFTQVCKMTDVYEGSLIRMFRRLEELIKQLADAAKTIGNVALEEKMTATLNLVHRDIVSAGSLYL